MTDSIKEDTESKEIEEFHKAKDVLLRVMGAGITPHKDDAFELTIHVVSLLVKLYESIYGSVYYVNEKYVVRKNSRGVFSINKKDDDMLNPEDNYVYDTYHLEKMCTLFSDNNSIIIYPLKDGDSMLSVYSKNKNFVSIIDEINKALMKEELNKMGTIISVFIDGDKRYVTCIDKIYSETTLESTQIISRVTASSYLMTVPEENRNLKKNIYMRLRKEWMEITPNSLTQKLNKELTETLLYIINIRKKKTEKHIYYDIEYYYIDEVKGINFSIETYLENDEGETILSKLKEANKSRWSLKYE